MADPKAFTYESPIEEAFAASVLPQLHDSVRVETQSEMRWGCGKKYRADFLFESHGRRVVAECDGRDFHDFNQDRGRDIVMMLACGITDVIRLRGCDIYFDVKSCAHSIGLFMRFLLDATAEPYSLADKALNSIHLRHAEFKPVYRCRASLEDTVKQRATADYDTFSCLGRTPDNEAIVQFKTPYWNRRYRGVKAWSLADYARIEMAGTP